MSPTEIIRELERLNNSERLQVIEAATHLIQHDLLAARPHTREQQEQRLKAAAVAVRDLYEPGGELTEWTSLDGEDIVDGSVPG